MSFDAGLYSRLINHLASSVPYNIYIMEPYTAKVKQRHLYEESHFDDRLICFFFFLPFTRMKMTVSSSSYKL